MCLSLWSWSRFCICGRIIGELSKGSRCVASGAFLRLYRYFRAALGCLLRCVWILVAFRLDAECIALGYWLRYGGMPVAEQWRFNCFHVVCISKNKGYFVAFLPVLHVYALRCRDVLCDCLFTKRRFYGSLCFICLVCWEDNGALCVKYCFCVVEKVFSFWLCHI